MTATVVAEPAPMPVPRRLAARDLARVASVGIRTRKLRSALSALGIAIGVAAIVAVLGLSSSSQAGLLAEIDRLGTNLLTVGAGTGPGGDAVALPAEAPAMIGRIDDVDDVEAVGSVDVPVYRNRLIDPVNTNSIAVLAATPGLLPAVGTALADGVFLNEASGTLPNVVLGASAAVRLGIDHVIAGQRILVGGEWFSVVGILEPAPLDPDIDVAVLVGFEAAEEYLGFDGHPTTIYVRPNTETVAAVRPLLAPTANPTQPNGVSVSRPSDALVARAKAQSALNSLFLGLGAISLLVGTVGVANIMVISVLERRSEIGLRRALGATRGHIRVQFLSEAVLLSLLGGAIGVAVGVSATAVYATTKGWAIVIPPVAWAGGFGAALLIGAVAGLMPALRAARLSPTRALWAS